MTVDNMRLVCRLSRHLAIGRVRERRLPGRYAPDLRRSAVRTFAPRGIDVGTTKNGEARTFPLTSDLRRVLRAQHAEHERFKKAGHIFRFVFFGEVAEGRGGDKKPQRIVSFAKAWRSACRAAGCPGRRRLRRAIRQ